MAEMFAPLTRAAGSSLPVSIVGATGTGKERIARATHSLSGRSGSFFAVNCAALPENMAEAELFGYRRGAFTGADRNSPGFFRLADGGTLFLDELPELPLALQAKLLRVLEDGLVTGLGEPAPTLVDVRIVSAGQHSLHELVARGRIRQDLAARLSGLELRLPALAERRGDVAPLFQQFVRQLCGGRPPAIEGRLIEALCLHDWPQNVRELELVTRRLLAVHGHEPTLKRKHLPDTLMALNEGTAGAPAVAPGRERNEYDLARIKQALAENGGSVKEAAQALGISRQRIYRLLKEEQAGDGEEAEE
jgi:transcriptional regulator with PAS, ATPase and Fis domain